MKAFVSIVEVARDSHPQNRGFILEAGHSRVMPTDEGVKSERASRLLYDRAPVALAGWLDE